MSIKFKTKILLSILIVGVSLFRVSDFSAAHCMKRAPEKSLIQVIPPKRKACLLKEWFRLLQEGSIPELKEFISCNGREYVNLKSDEGALPLNCVERIEIAKFLIDNGADINAVDECGRPPLWCAVSRAAGEADNGQHAIIDLLLAHHANVNFYVWPNGTVLHVAAYAGDVPLMEHLYRYGGDLGIVNAHGLTPMDVCRNLYGEEEKIAVRLNSLIREYFNRDEYEDVF